MPIGKIDKPGAGEVLPGDGEPFLYAPERQGIVHEPVAALDLAQSSSQVPMAVRVEDPFFARYLHPARPIGESHADEPVIQPLAHVAADEVWAVLSWSAKKALFDFFTKFFPNNFREFKKLSLPDALQTIERAFNKTSSRYFQPREFPYEGIPHSELWEALTVLHFSFVHVLGMEGGKVFCSFLVLARRQAGLDSGDLSHSMGIKKWELDEIENGKRRPSLAMFYAWFSQIYPALGKSGVKKLKRKLLGNELPPKSALLSKLERDPVREKRKLAHYVNQHYLKRDPQSGAVYLAIPAPWTRRAVDELLQKNFKELVAGSTRGLFLKDFLKRHDIPWGTYSNLSMQQRPFERGIPTLPVLQKFATALGVPDIVLILFFIPKLANQIELRFEAGEVQTVEFSEQEHALPPMPLELLRQVTRLLREVKAAGEEFCLSHDPVTGDYNLISPFEPDMEKIRDIDFIALLKKKAGDIPIPQYLKPYFKHSYEFYHLLKPGKLPHLANLKKISQVLGLPIALILLKICPALARHVKINGKNINYNSTYLFDEEVLDVVKPETRKWLEQIRHSKQARLMGHLVRFDPVAALPFIEIPANWTVKKILDLDFKELVKQKRGFVPFGRFLAEHGIPEMTYAYFLEGYVPSEETFKKLARSLGVPEAVLLAKIIHEFTDHVQIRFVPIPEEKVRLVSAIVEGEPKGTFTVLQTRELFRLIDECEREQESFLIRDAQKDEIVVLLPAPWNLQSIRDLNLKKILNERKKSQGRDGYLRRYGLSPRGFYNCFENRMPRLATLKKLSRALAIPVPVILLNLVSDLADYVKIKMIPVPTPKTAVTPRRGSPVAVIGTPLATSPSTDGNAPKAMVDFISGHIALEMGSLAAAGATFNPVPADSFLEETDLAVVGQQDAGEIDLPVLNSGKSGILVGARFSSGILPSLLSCF